MDKTRASVVLWGCFRGRLFHLICLLGRRSSGCGPRSRKPRKGAICDCKEVGARISSARRHVEPVRNGPGSACVVEHARLRAATTARAFFRAGIVANSLEKCNTDMADPRLGSTHFWRDELPIVPSVTCKSLHSVSGPNVRFRGRAAALGTDHPRGWNDWQRSTPIADLPAR